MYFFNLSSYHISFENPLRFVSAQVTLVRAVHLGGKLLLAAALRQVVNDNW